MQIEASWSRPIDLTKCKPGGLTYELDTDQLPAEPGIYVFGRTYRNAVIPIYIGETISVRGRIKGHLNSLPLMRVIENAPNGPRFLLYCTVKAGSVQKAKKHVKIVEKALILHAQSEGFVLYNKKGTKLPTDEITDTLHWPRSGFCKAFVSMVNTPFVPIIIWSTFASPVCTSWKTAKP